MKENKTIKKPTVSSIVILSIASVCIVVYIGAIAFAAIRLYTGMTERRNHAEQEFFELVDLSSSAGVLGFMNESFQDTIKDALITSKTLQGVIISGPNEEYAFERERGIAIIWTGDAPQFRSSFGLSKEQFFQPIRIEGQRNVSIRAVFSYIDPNLFILVLKRTLLVILITLSVAFCTLILQFLLSDKRAPERSLVETSEEAQEGLPMELRSEDLFREAEAEVNAETETRDDLPQELHEDFFLPPITHTDFDLSDVLEPLDENEAAEEPRGLYAPRSNIGWEAYTKERLASELHQCASFDQDMVFIIMEFKDTGALEESSYKLLADEAVAFFTHRDLIFEKGSWGISVIIPNIDLDQALTVSQEFHKRVAGKCSAFPEIPQLCIGLSSRSGRLVDTERLMLEASQALKRAWDDEGLPIVAFRSDPEKYRAFIAAQNKSGL
ncbi:MAG: hypothetical protein LBU17_10285 [Treponema sp.]|jgi:hypothetical protein|nr:hypothetical protein [Treponema sp.]